MQRGRGVGEGGRTVVLMQPCCFQLHNYNKAVTVNPHQSFSVSNKDRLFKLTSPHLVIIYSLGKHPQHSA